MVNYVKKILLSNANPWCHGYCHGDCRSTASWGWTLQGQARRGPTYRDAQGLQQSHAALRGERHLPRGKALAFMVHTLRMKPWLISTN